VQEREGIMLRKVQNAKEVWGEVDQILSKWLLERRDLITAYCTLINDKHTCGGANRELEQFCEVLMDYLSAGHFEIFTELEFEARTFDARGIQLVKALYPYLEQSTEIALGFNDRCDQLRESDADFSQIRAELSYLGECLTDRFELEDQLIEYVHTANAELCH